MLETGEIECSVAPVIRRYMVKTLKQLTPRLSRYISSHVFLEFLLVGGISKFHCFLKQCKSYLSLVTKWHTPFRITGPKSSIQFRIPSP